MKVAMVFGVEIAMNFPDNIREVPKYDRLQWSYCIHRPHIAPSLKPHHYINNHAVSSSFLDKRHCLNNKASDLALRAKKKRWEVWHRYVYFALFKKDSRVTW